MRNGEVAAIAAGAEAHLTGELTVWAESCGPSNLIASHIRCAGEMQLLRDRDEIALMAKLHGLTTRLDPRRAVLPPRGG